MSQLNPNAAEFVPVSPTRNIASPVCRTLMNDPVIAQSPKKPSELDINLPNPQDFEEEVKSRPGDFDSSYSNVHSDQDDRESSSEELMENLLNGKNIDEISKFQPSSTPTKVLVSEEFHFGPNASPFSLSKLLDQSETALSTKAIFGDESTVIFDSRYHAPTVSKDNVDFTFKHIRTDAMSASFYQDKEGSGDVDFFDLNKVQILPENLDDFLRKSDDQNIPHEDVSDLPEHDLPKYRFLDEVILDNDQRIQTTDLDQVIDESKLSFVSNEGELISGVCELSKSPNVLDTDLQFDTLPDVCVRPELKSFQLEVTGEVCSFLKKKSFEPVEKCPSETEMSEFLTESPEPQMFPRASAAPFLSSDLKTIALEPQIFLPELKSLSPNVRASPEPQTQFFNPQLEELSSELHVKLSEAETVSPELREDYSEITKSSVVPTNELCENIVSWAESPESEKTIFSEPKQVTEITSESINVTKGEDMVEHECMFDVDKQKEILIESPIDVTSSAKDFASYVTSSVQDQISNDTSIQLNYAQEINSAIQSTVSIECLSLIQGENMTREACPVSTPKSVTDTASVFLADVNSVLEKSQISDLASPLNPDEPLIHSDGTIILNHALHKCVYPLPVAVTEVKVESIIPQFAEPAVITSTEPTKEHTSSISLLQEDIVKELETVIRNTAICTVSGLATTSTTTATVTAEGKTTFKPKTLAAAAKVKASQTAKPRPVSSSKLTATTIMPTLTAKPTSKPKTTRPASKPSTTEKKIVNNGDVKGLIKSNVTVKKPFDGSKATSKLASTTKPIPIIQTTTRPTTAPAKAVGTRVTSTTALKARPNALVKTNTSSSSVMKNVVTSTATGSKSSVPKSSTSCAKPASSPKARAASAKLSTPVSKIMTRTSVDAEKQNKDSANKLTASSRTISSTRTISGTASTGTVTTTIQKTDVKATSITPTTMMKIATPTKPNTAVKKAQEKISDGCKTTPTKTKSPIQNGVTTVVAKQTTIVNNTVNENDTQLMKDNSPADNKLILEANAAK